MSTILRQIAAVLFLAVLTVAALGGMQNAPAQSLGQLLTPPGETGEAASAEQAQAPALGPTEARLLINLLRDDAAREALIAGLEQISEERAAEAVPQADENASANGLPAEAASGAPPAEDESTTTFGRQLATQTQAIARGFAVNVERVWSGLIQSPARFTGLQRIKTDFLLDILAELAFSIAVTVGLFLILRQLGRRFYRWLGERATTRSAGVKVALYLISLIADAAAVLIAWAAGYALTMAFFGEFGDITIRQTLYLNAFLAVETVKLGIRAVLSPSLGQLRPVNVGDEGAKRSYRVLNIVTSIIGYGQLLVVPIVARQVGYFGGRSVSTLLLLIAFVILGWAVVRNRNAVAEWLLAGLERRRRGNQFWRRIARLWWVPVMLYLAAVLVIVLVEPGNVLMPVLWGSVRILIASVIGWAVAGVLGFVIKRGVRLPASVNWRLPMLERRLNAIIPRALFILRLIILAVVIIYAMHIARLIDARAWLESAGGLWLTGTALSVTLILLVAFVIWVALASWVDYRLNPNYGPVATARQSTLLTLLRNAATVTLIVITLMLVLSEIGVDIAPLIASAGIVGLAIGFGAQKLVQDIITGLFIQLENAINVGDVVTAGTVTGVAERLTIRSVSLRDFSGVYHIVPFSSVDTVSNFMREFAYSVTDMQVAHRVDIGQAKQAMFDAFEELRADPDIGPTILDDLEWYGVNNFVESGVVLRARIKTLPGNQWAAGRAYNGIIKRIFDERGIEILVPHRMLYIGQGEQGEARVAVDADQLAGHPADAGPRSEGESDSEAMPEAGDNSTEKPS
ncbi:MAG TPA: mechanosensitive ion channel domain-containing protein [Paracoccaceae bacterium]|nr:mechanosensitive ion channel domain-containing protein [Paracoccaceae bacterium]